MNASPPLTRNSSTAATAAAATATARLGEQQPLYRRAIPFDQSAPLPTHRRTVTNHNGQRFNTGARCPPCSQSVCLHAERLRTRRLVSTLSPTPDRSWTGDRQVSPSLAQLEDRVAGWTWLLFSKPSTSRPFSQKPALQRHSGRALLGGAILGNNGRTERDRPHLLNDLIPPIDIHPNLLLTNSAYMTGLPELIISSEVLVIKG